MGESDLAEGSLQVEMVALELRLGIGSLEEAFPWEERVVLGRHSVLGKEAKAFHDQWVEESCRA